MTTPYGGGYNRYATGDKVYGGIGGPGAPTQGTVDPTGYVDRERRSGLAAAALQRTASGGLDGAPQAGQVAMGSGYAPRPTVSPVGKITPAPVIPNQTYNPALNTQTPVGSATPVVAPAASWAPMSNSQYALPFDYQGSIDMINANKSYGDLINQLIMERQNAQSSYARGMHQLDVTQPTDERNLLNNYGSRGLAHGSGYGVAYGNLENQYADQRSNAANDLAQALQQAAMQQTQGYNNLQWTTSAIQQAIAQRLAAQAGTLGLR